VIAAMPQDRRLPGFNFNVEEWDAKGQTYETLAICRSLALARAAFKRLSSMANENHASGKARAREPAAVVFPGTLPARAMDAQSLRRAPKWPDALQYLRTTHCRRHWLQRPPSNRSDDQTGVMTSTVVIPLSAPIMSQFLLKAAVSFFRVLGRNSIWRRKCDGK
jgi:hypothetical protein